jgi:hypothetical protein
MSPNRHPGDPSLLGDNDAPHEYLIAEQVSTTSRIGILAIRLIYGKQPGSCFLSSFKMLKAWQATCGLSICLNDCNIQQENIYGKSRDIPPRTVRRSLVDTHD